MGRMTWILKLALVVFFWDATNAMFASKRPFLVNTVKYSAVSSQNATRLPGRTREKFFENVLGIRPGEIFEFPLEKWRAIQRSHLFHNITGRTYQSDDGIVMEVQAIENPSISIKPEVSVGLSPSNPDISGGVSNAIHMVGNLSNFVFHAGSDSRSKLSRTWRKIGTVSNKKGRN